jgi:hypothetical protein
VCHRKSLALFLSLHYCVSLFLGFLSPKTYPVSLNLSLSLLRRPLFVSLLSLSFRRFTKIVFVSLSFGLPLSVKPSPDRSPRLHSIRTQLPRFLSCHHNGDADPPSKRAIRPSDFLPCKATGLGLSPLFCHFLRLCACWLLYKGP